MEKRKLRAVAAQLAQPRGELGSDISSKMNDTNAFITARSIEALAPTAGDVIVELGPGNGALSCGLVQTLGSQGSYLGIEISSEMAQVAEQTLRAAGDAAVTVHNGDCLTAMVTDASITGLLAVNVLYFVEDMDSLLARIRPWFQFGGRCVFGIRPARTLESLCFHEFGYHIRSPDVIVQALRVHGFGAIEITDYDEGQGALGDITFPNGSIIIKALALN